MILTFTYHHHTKTNISPNEPEIQTLLNTDTSPALVEPQIDAPEPIQPVQEIISLVPDEPEIQTISNSNISPDPVEQQLEEPVPIQPVQEIIPLVPDEPESGQPIVRMLDASQFLGEWYDGIPSKDENGQVIFIVNMETGKIHKPGCQYTNFSKYEYERAVTIYPNELIDSNPSFYAENVVDVTTNPDSNFYSESVLPGADFSLLPPFCSCFCACDMLQWVQKFRNPSPKGAFS